LFNWGTSVSPKPGIRSVALVFAISNSRDLELRFKSFRLTARSASFRFNERISPKRLCELLGDRITNRCEAAQICCGRIWDGRLEDSRRNSLRLEGLAI